MEKYKLALFGESEKGDYSKPYFCHNLPQLVENLGNPPAESHGIFFAIQALLYQRELIFFRVREEGFSYQDYLKGLKFLEDQNFIDQLAAIFLPGVGDVEIMEAIKPVCQMHHSILITTESDFYDYLTE